MKSAVFYWSRKKDSINGYAVFDQHGKLAGFVRCVVLGEHFLKALEQAKPLKNEMVLNAIEVEP